MREFVRQLLVILFLAVFLSYVFVSFRSVQGQFERRVYRKLPVNLEHYRELANFRERSLLSSLDDTLHQHPLEILDQLAHDKINLQPDLQNWLAFDALENLARKLETEPNHRQSLAILQHAHALANRLKDKCEILPNIVLSLKRDTEANQRRVDLKTISESFDTQDYSAALGLAKDLLEEQSIRDQMRTALENTVLALQTRVAMKQLEQALIVERIATSTDFDRLAAWKPLNPAHLPSEVQKHAASFRGLRVLGPMSANRWETSPDSGEIRSAIDHLRLGLRDGLMATRLQQDLAIKAFLEGYPKVSLEIFPRFGDSAHASKRIESLTRFLKEVDQDPSASRRANLEMNQSAHVYPGLVSIMGPNIPGNLNPPFDLSFEYLEELGQKSAIWLVNLENRISDANRKTSDLINRADELLDAVLIQLGLDEEENTKWLAKIHSRGQTNLSLVEKAIAIELKREKFSLDESMNYLRNLPNFLSDPSRH